MTVAESDIQQELSAQLGLPAPLAQATADGVATCWISAEQLRPALRWLKNECSGAFSMLYDLTGIDERLRAGAKPGPARDFAVVYHLLSVERNADVRLKVPLSGEFPSLPSVADIFPNADWYERELWDMFGITPTGHPNLRRILSPPWWQGHPLRKEHYARATERPAFHLNDQIQANLESELEFRPEEWGLKRRGDDFDFMFLNVGPHHPGTHGLLRLILQLRGQEITDAVCDIGFHHRGAEKMGERQTWHTYIPYTDRVDYLSGVANNLPYVLSVEALAGIEIPPRAQVIRVMMTELYRIISHLVFYGTFSQDLGQMSPVFYMFNDREKALDIAEAITGGRMHPSWFRIGGVAMDLPEGWQAMVREFIKYLPKRLKDYDTVVLHNRIFQGRTRGVGAFSVEQALEWGATGPMLRSAGLAWDMRKARPYSGYEQFAFDIPIGQSGDCYDRAVVHVEEMRQSLRIIEQCMQNMPAGEYKSRHPLTCPPLKEHTMQDIETLINHFLGTTWGPVIPAGEANVHTEGPKGMYSYYLTSDGSTNSYRTRIRSASFPHIQMVPMLSRGMTVSDLVAILGSVDFVLADVDR